MHHNAMRQIADKRKERAMNPVRVGGRAILANVRRTMLFTIGSALILREKAYEFIEQAIAEGEAVQDEGKKLVQEMRAERRAKQPRRTDALDDHITNALNRLGIPTQKDFDQLNLNVDELSERIDRLL
jgi:polyhydroxyalkanoate synthesis regulator phasin